VTKPERHADSTNANSTKELSEGHARQSVSPQGNVRRRKRKRIFACVSLLLGVLVSVLLAEIGMRVYVAARGWTANCYATGDAFFVPHSTAGYTLRPGLRLKSTTYDVTVNSMGFRGPELKQGTQETSGRVIQCVVLGGSSVFGYLVADGLDSCALAEDRLIASDGLRASGVELEVVNAGVPGYTLEQCRLRFEQDIAPLSPDYVLVYLGWNDIPFLISDSPEELDATPPPPAWWKRMLSHSPLYGLVAYRLFPTSSPVFAPPAESATVVSGAGGALFERRLRQLLDSIEDSGAEPILCTQVMAGGQNCDGLEVFLGEEPEQIAANRSVARWITETIRRVARERHTELVDCAATVPCNSMNLGDAIHLTELGHQKVAEAWADKLIALTPEARSP
jgi:lysophospholipase L1-like esterase